MKALQLDRPSGQTKKGEGCIVEVRDVPIPRTGGDTVLLKVGARGSLTRMLTDRSSLPASTAGTNGLR